MAYFQQIQKPVLKPLGIELEGKRTFLQIEFSGYASSSPYDIIKVENKVSGSWSAVHSETLTSASGIIKTIVAIDKNATHIRVKGYDSDGTTALTNAEGTERKVFFLSNEKKNKERKNIDNVAFEAQGVLKNLISDTPFAVDIKKGYHSMFRKAMKSSYADIEANNSLDVTETTITDNMTSNGLNQFPPYLQKAITLHKNWVINGANLPNPLWIIDDKVYNFKVTGSDNGALKAKRCEEVLVAKLSKFFALEERSRRQFGTSEYSKLTTAATTAEALAAEKIDLI